MQRRKVWGAGGEPVKVPQPAPGTRDVELRRSAEQAADQAAYQRAYKRMKAVQAFYAHLTAYTGVNLMLFFVDFFTGSGIWFFWPLLIWGAAIALHASITFRWLPFYGREWEEAKVRRFMEEEQQIPEL
ncbi:MAG: 2TM domain-containing protein [Kiloniellales bacterium]